MASVSALTYYPIKGCAGVTVEGARVGWTGIAYDRSFVVVDAHGVFISQRTLARLAVVRAQVLHDGAKLALAAPDIGDLMVDVSPDGPVRPVRVHIWDGSGVDQGDE